MYLVDMGAVPLRESGITVKRLALDRDARSVVLLSDNEDYAAKVVPLENVALGRSIIGQVVWHGAEVK